MKIQCKDINELKELFWKQMNSGNDVAMDLANLVITVYNKGEKDEQSDVIQE